MSQPLKGLYAITDPELAPGDRVLSAAEAALRGGATLLQYRDKPADADTRRHRAARLALLCKDYGARFIVNDDAALAAEVEADGVHLGQSDGAVGRARMLLGDDKLIGVSDSVLTSFGLGEDLSVWLLGLDAKVSREASRPSIDFIVWAYACLQRDPSGLNQNVAVQDAVQVASSLM